MSNEKLMNTRIRQKIDTSENWAKATGFSPREGELIVYSDLHKIKVGDGTTNVNDLPFSTGGVTYVTATRAEDYGWRCSHSPEKIVQLVKQGQIVQLKRIYDGDNIDDDDIFTLVDYYYDQQHKDESFVTFSRADEDPHSEIIWVYSDQTIESSEYWFASRGDIESYSYVLNIARHHDETTGEITYSVDNFDQREMELVMRNRHLLIAKVYDPNDMGELCYNCLLSNYEADEGLFEFTYVAERDTINGGGDGRGVIRTFEIRGADNIVVTERCDIVDLTWLYQNKYSDQDVSKYLLTIERAGTYKIDTINDVYICEVQLGPGGPFHTITDFCDDGLLYVDKYSNGNLVSSIGYSSGEEQHLTKLLVSDPTSELQAANKRYVDNSISQKLSELEGGGAGESTDSGGAIFGDTDTNEATGSNAVVMGESSQALGDNSLAIGKEVQTGCKGYYIKAIDPANRYIYLATDGVERVPTWTNPSDHYDSNFNTGYTIITPEEIQTGEFPAYANEFSISSEDYYHWVFAADIVDISGNRIQYSEKNIMSENPDKEHAAYKKWMENFEGKAKPMKFYVPTQSEAGNIVTGHYTLAVGKGSVAAEDYAVAEGRYNLAVGYAAHVEGDSNRAGYTSHAEGVRTQALGLGAHTEGQETVATGRFAHAQGSGSEATGDFAHAEGYYTKATGNYSHAQGSGSEASGMYANAQGVNTTASGRFSHAGGRASIAAGEGTIAQGENPAAFAPYSVALGYKTQTGYADAENQKEFQHLLGSLVTGENMTFEYEEQSQIITIPLQATQVDFSYTTEEEVHLPGNDFDISLELTLQYLNEKRESIGEFKFGTNNIPTGARYMRINGHPSTTGSAGFAVIHMRNISFQFTISQPVGTSSLAFGSYTAALGNHSLAGGLYTTASGSRAIALGEGSSDNRTEATGDVSIAMGKHVKATNTGSVALGADTTASGEYSIALGKNTSATASHAFANGINTKATQSHAIALGSNSNAKGIASLAFGDTNNAEKAYTWALGQRNIVNAIHSLAVGRDNTTNGQFNLAIGEGNTTTGKYAMALGNGATANGKNAIALGSGAYAGPNEIAIGNYNKIGLFVDENANHSIDITRNAITFKGTVNESILSIGDFGITMDRTGDAAPPSIGEGVIAAGGGCAATGCLSVAISDFLDATGDYSFAMGQGQPERSTETGEVIKFGAHGGYSVAFGYNVNAEGSHSLAFGDHAHASDNFALAFGAFASADAPNSVAIGGNATASGYSSFALGYGTTAGGKYSVTFGQNTSTAAEGAIAFGNTSKANVTSSSGAYNSLVGGYYSESSHSATIVVGNQLRSANINGAVFGQYNSIEGLGATANDRALLILGNGSSDSARSNAFVVLRDGRMILGSGSHGTALPASGYEGQIFFLES